MKFVAGKVNDELLSKYTTDKTPHCSKVLAAVAYASQEQLQLFEDCRSNGKPLTFYGRYDLSVPVAPEVIKWFIDAASPNCVCRLVPDILHAKVIWWVGVGVYIGSANLTSRAWYMNIEAGTFHDQEEIESTSLLGELQLFFAAVERHSQPVDNDVYRHLLDLKKARVPIEQAEYEYTRKVKRRFPPGVLTAIPPHEKGDRERLAFEKFEKSWRESLLELQKITARVIQDEYRPGWIPEDTPAGAQADQFVHAYYYKFIKGHKGDKYLNLPMPKGRGF